MTETAQLPLVARLNAWLAALDGAPVECDGFTRLASILLSREGIAHEVHVGRLTLGDVGTIAPHFWIRLPDNLICDFRARMWLGSLAPHGVFRARPAYTYVSRETRPSEDSPMLFWVLSGLELDAYPRLPA